MQEALFWPPALWTGNPWVPILAGCSVQELQLLFPCFVCLSEHLLFSADSYLTAVSNSSTYIILLVFFLLSKTEFFHLEMTDEVNQLKREKRSIRE